MAIYINPYLGSESRVFDLLLKISGCDPGLSSVPDVDSLDIRFTPKGAPSFSSNRLREIVGSPKDVWIHGVDDSFMTVWGMPMIEYAGVTDVDITASTQECSIWIDITEAGGLGYRSLDANGNYIYAPPAVILFHELAHVYHSLIVEDTPGTAAPDQLLAIADENQFRAQLGLPARNPNVTMHTIYGPSTVGPTVLKGCNEALFPDLCKCNIATAALGTPIARQIVEFRRAKRDLEPLTFCGAPVLAPMWNAYQMFSPLVAGRMLSDAALRDLMLRFGVQPAVHLLRIVRTYLGTSPVDATLVAEIERIIGDYLRATSGSRDELLSAADAAAEAGRMLRARVTVKPPKWCAVPQDLFTTIAFNVQVSGADSEGTAWVLDGIACFLRAAVESPDWIEEVGPNGQFCWWLAQVPLPAINAGIPPPQLADELKELRARIYRHPDVRKTFAHRVLADFPALEHDLRAALAAADYLMPDTPKSIVFQVN